MGTVNNTEVCQGDISGNVQCDIAILANLNTALGSNIADGAHFSPNANPGTDHASYVAGHGNGANCTAGSYPLGVDAAGAIEDCTDATTEIDSAIATHSAIVDDHHTATVSGDITHDSTTGNRTATHLTIGADPTADGQVVWNTTTERVQVGDDGVATAEIYTGAHSTECASSSCDLDASTTIGTAAISTGTHTPDIDAVTGQDAWGTAATKDAADLTISGVEVDYHNGSSAGYPLLYSNTAPPGTACDAAAEYGRIMFDSDADTDGSVVVCTSAGWKEIDDDGGAGGFADFDFDGDDNDPRTITDGEEMLITGGANGIDTNTEAGDELRITFDSTEVAGTTVWGGGSSQTWQWNAGATDPQFVFASDSIAITNAATLTLAGSQLALESQTCGAGDCTLTTSDTINTDNVTLDNSWAVGQGGTGATDAANARTNLDVPQIGEVTTGNYCTWDGTGTEIDCQSAGASETNTLTTVLTGIIDDQFVIGGAGVATYDTVPDCDASGNALTYDTTANNVACTTDIATDTELAAWTGSANIATVGALTSGSLGAGFTDVPVLQGGTGGSDAATARTNLDAAQQGDVGTGGEFCTWDNVGTEIDCNTSGALADDDLSDDAPTALSGVTTINDGQFCQGAAANGFDCDVTDIPVSAGGTGSDYFTVAGPTATRTYTFPDADSTLTYSGCTDCITDAMVSDTLTATPPDIDAVTGQNAWGTAATKTAADLTIDGVEVDFHAGGSPGYPKLSGQATCAATACDAAAEYGRLCFDTDEDTTGSVMQCTSNGWEDVDREVATDLDIASEAQGDLLIRGASTWDRLADSGTASECLLSGGAGGDPAWNTCPGGSGYWTDLAPNLEPNDDGDGIQLNSSAGTEYCLISHDGTDLEMDCTSTTQLDVDVPITSSGALTGSSVATTAAATASVDFDTSDAGTANEAEINVNCPTANDCDLSIGVNSGGDAITTVVKIDTTDAGATTVELGTPGTNSIVIAESGAATFQGTAAIDLETGTAPLTNIADDEVLMGSGAGTGAYITMPTGETNGCAGSGEALQYNTTTNAFACITGLAAGGGDSITVNTNAVTDADFDDATPAAAAGDVNIKWQYTGASPTDISGYLDLALIDGQGLSVSGSELAADVYTGCTDCVTDSMVSNTLTASALTGTAVGDSNIAAGAVDLDTTEVAGTLTVDKGGTGLSNPADHALLAGSGASAMTALTVGTNGQLLVGSTGADPVFYTLNADRSLTTTAGAGTLEIDADEETYRGEESWVIYSGVATAGDELLVHTNYAITLVSLDCVVTGSTTPTVTVNVVECTNAGATCANSGLTASPAATTTLYTDDSPTDGAIDANDWWGLDLTTLTTEGDIMHCTVEYTRND